MKLIKIEDVDSTAFCLAGDPSLFGDRPVQFQELRRGFGRDGFFLSEKGVISALAAVFVGNEKVFSESAEERFQFADILMGGFGGVNIPLRDHYRTLADRFSDQGDEPALFHTSNGDIELTKLGKEVGYRLTLMAEAILLAGKACHASLLPMSVHIEREDPGFLLVGEYSDGTHHDLAWASHQALAERLRWAMANPVATGAIRAAEGQINQELAVSVGEKGERVFAARDRLGGDQEKVRVIRVNDVTEQMAQLSIGFGSAIDRARGIHDAPADGISP